MEREDFAAACPKLAASVRLDPGIGAMLFLAECQSRAGQIASAWAEFREAAAFAASRHDPREGLARQRAAQLEPRLSRLVVAVSGPDTSELLVRRDGEVLDRAAWGVGVPVDPGPHVVEASAPGKVTFRATANVDVSAGVATVSVPALKDLAAPAPVAEPSASQPEAPSLHDTSPPHPAPGTRRILALAAGGLGVVGLGLGTYFAVDAKVRFNDSNGDGHCHGNACDTYGLNARHDAQTQATLSTVAFSVGAAALGAGLVLWLTAPRAGAQIAVVPAAGPREQGLVVVGQF